MSEISHVDAYDATVELTDDYTNLFTRPKARKLISSLMKRLSSIGENDVLALDFSSVTGIDHSFLDEFLVPVLRDIRGGKLGGRLVAGINFDAAKLDENFIHSELVGAEVSFLTLDRTGKAMWFGISDTLTRRIIEHIYNSRIETLEHIQVLFYENQERVGQVIEDLVSQKLIRRTAIGSMGVENIIPTIDITNTLSKASDSAMDELKKRVFGSVEKGCHYELTPLIHVSEYLHLSRLFSDARLTARIAMRAAEAYNSNPPDVVVTVGTPSALVFSQRLAEYFGAMCIFVNIDDNCIAHASSGLSLPATGLILISVDVLSTGHDIRALLEFVQPRADSLIGICAAVDVSGGSVTFPPFTLNSVLALPLPQFKKWQCPMCRQGIPFRKASTIHLELRS